MKRELKEARRPLGVALGLGLFFVFAQGVEWSALIQEGLTLTSSNHGGFFYLIVGAHALHACAAILALGWALFRCSRGTLTREQLLTTSIFWYFVVGVWPVLYLRVYL